MGNYVKLQDVVSSYHVWINYNGFVSVGEYESDGE